MTRSDDETHPSEISQWQWGEDRTESELRDSTIISYVISHLWWRINASRLGDRFSVGAIVIVGLALVLRLLAIPLSLLQINPYSQADATGFTRRATRIGHGFRSGRILVRTLYRGRLSGLPEAILGGGGSSIDLSEYWGLLLSPFWILPGPSAVYAYIGVALLGTLAAYNVYALGRHYRFSAVGVLAAFPIAVYPSFVFTHATLLREAIVLAGITTAAHLLIISSRRFSGRVRLVLAVVILIIIAPLRPENVPLYLLVLAVAAGVDLLQYGNIDQRVKALVVGLAIGTVGFVGAAISPRVINRLGDIHRYRARGRTAYLGWIGFRTVPEAIVFAPLGALYFLFTPFPWMVHTVADGVVAIEALGNIVFAVGALWGVRYAFRRSPSRTAALFVGFLAASLLYGIAEANVGTAVRHRQMFIWIVYLFGSMGIMNWISDRELLPT